jgi:hypothetical protein
LLIVNGHRHRYFHTLVWPLAESCRSNASDNNSFSDSTTVCILHARFFPRRIAMIFPHWLRNQFRFRDAGGEKVDEQNPGAPGAGWHHRPGLRGIAAGPAVHRTEVCRHRLRHRSAQRRYPRQGPNPTFTASARKKFRPPTRRDFPPYSTTPAWMRWTPSSSASRPLSTNITNPTSASSPTSPHAIAPHLQAGQLVVLESTTYPRHHGRNVGRVKCSPSSDSNEK